MIANQMAILFDKDEKTVRKHINNIFKDVKGYVINVNRVVVSNGNYIKLSSDALASR